MTKRFNFFKTKLEGIIVCERKPIVHDLGSFVRSFCDEEFKTVGLQKSIAQINMTTTHSKWSVRGMHYQTPPFSETKIVTCLKGEVFDVAVDIRSGSPTFLQWYGEILSPANNKSLYIPEGFAHGYQTLTTDCEMLYMHTAPYEAGSEGGIHAEDPATAIQWPFKIMEMSNRDHNHSFLSKDFKGIKL